MTRLREMLRCHAIFDTGKNRGRCERHLFHRGFHETHLWGPSFGVANWL